MEVGHAFSAVAAVVDDDPEATGKSLFLCQGGGCEEQVSEDALVLRAGFPDAREGLAGNDEDMHRGLRVDVADGEGRIVFVEDFGGDFAGEDFFKERRHQSVGGLGGEGSITCLPRERP